MPWRSKTENGKTNNGELENILGPTIVIRGDLKAEGGFRIDGKIEGSVESSSTVIVGETGVVNGDVKGTDIVVAGHVHGNVLASGHLEIVSTGKLEGDIEAVSVRIEKGGLYRGTSRMGSPATDGERQGAPAVNTGRLSTVA